MLPKLPVPFSEIDSLRDKLQGELSTSEAVLKIKHAELASDKKTFRTKNTELDKLSIRITELKTVITALDEDITRMENELVIITDYKSGEPLADSGAKTPFTKYPRRSETTYIGEYDLSDRDRSRRWSQMREAQSRTIPSGSQGDSEGSQGDPTQYGCVFPKTPPPVVKRAGGSSDDAQASQDRDGRDVFKSILDEAISLVKDNKIADSDYDKNIADLLGKAKKLEDTLAKQSRREELRYSGGGISVRRHRRNKSKKKKSIKKKSKKKK